jgi:hypothetical protein
MLNQQQYLNDCLEPFFEELLKEEKLHILSAG